MYLGIVTIHVVLSVLLILIILLQPGKGGDVGAAFGGGGGSSLFGPRGPTSLLSQATTFVAVGFFCTSVVLAYFSNQELLADSDVLEELERVGRERKEKADQEGPPAEDVPAFPGEVPVIEVEPVDEPAGSGAGGDTP